MIPQTYNQVLLDFCLAEQPRKAVSPATCFKPKPTPIKIDKLAVPFFIKSYNFHVLLFYSAVAEKFIKNLVIKLFKKLFSILCTVIVKQTVTTREDTHIPFR